MTAKTNHLARSDTKTLAHADNPLPDALHFTATCPACKDVRFQQGYGFRALVRSLVDDQPIEAYCAVCNEHWPVSANERAELAWLLITD